MKRLLIIFGMMLAGCASVTSASAELCRNNSEIQTLVDLGWSQVGGGHIAKHVIDLGSKNNPADLSDTFFKDLRTYEEFMNSWLANSTTVCPDSPSVGDTVVSNYVPAKVDGNYPSWFVGYECKSLKTSDGKTYCSEGENPFTPTEMRYVFKYKKSDASSLKYWVATTGYPKR